MCYIPYQGVAKLEGPLLVQVRGKGVWGKWEGMEKIFSLQSAASAFIQIPLNYGRVQAVLDALPSSDATMVKNTSKWHNKGFSGEIAKPGHFEIPQPGSCSVV